MERESFESPEVADLLNNNFVPIKIDREERPDVDAVYMQYVQATTGSGGWPLSVFLLPTLGRSFLATQIYRLTETLLLVRACLWWYLLPWPEAGFNQSQDLRSHYVS